MDELTLDQRWELEKEEIGQKMSEEKTMENKKVVIVFNFDISESNLSILSDRMKYSKNTEEWDVISSHSDVVVIRAENVNWNALAEELEEIQGAGGLNDLPELIIFGKEECPVGFDVYQVKKGKVVKKDEAKSRKTS